MGISEVGLLCKWRLVVKYKAIIKLTLVKALVDDDELRYQSAPLTFDHFQIIEESKWLWSLQDYLALCLKWGVQPVQYFWPLAQTVDFGVDLF